jgi:hypothetical protein
MAASAVSSALMVPSVPFKKKLHAGNAAGPLVSVTTSLSRHSLSSESVQTKTHGSSCLIIIMASQSELRFRPFDQGTVVPRHYVTFDAAPMFVLLVSRAGV